MRVTVAREGYVTSMLLRSREEQPDGGDAHYTVEERPEDEQ